MASFSVLTNSSAMNALFKLNQTQKALDKNQEAINTGYKVGSAKDDAATFVVAQGMRSDVAGFKKVRENMALGLSTLGTATEAAGQINNELTSIKEKIVQASNQETGRADIQTAIERSLENIRGFTSTATFNGINLIDGQRAQDGETFDVVSSMNRSAGGDLTLGRISVDYQDLSIEDADRGLGMLKGIDVTEGKSTETTTFRDDLVSASLNLGTDGTQTITTLSDDKQFSFTYEDAEGVEQTLTFTYEDSAGDVDTDFKFSGANADGASGAGNGTTSAALINLAAELNALTESGGVLHGLGFSFAANDTTGAAVDATTGTTAVELRATRDVNAQGGGKIVGFDAIDLSDDDGNAASVSTLDARPGNAAIDLQFNKPLDAGDTIDITFGDGTNSHTFTFVISEQGAGHNSGARVSGSLNQFHLAYEDVVSNSGTARTATEVSSTIAGILNATGDDADNNIGNFAHDVNVAVFGLVAGGTAADEIGEGNQFSFLANGDTITITDLSQEATNLYQIEAFNMDRASGGSLDFDFMLDLLNAAEAHLNSVTAQLGATEAALESQDTFMEALVNAVEGGIGTLVDANMAEESAKLQALQVQQQLGLQALSIANQQPQSILSLFR